MSVKPKKHLGQHFLTDLSIAEQIADALTTKHYAEVLEVGPGTGVLTQFLVDKENINLQVIEIDAESIVYLNQHLPQLKGKILQKSFLDFNFEGYKTKQVAIVGNFPYNISSQIVFKVLDYKHLIPEMVGMFQKEVAERIAAKPGGKTYGIISVLAQVYYDIEYLFTVPEHVFNPPPKVKSGVIIMQRKEKPTVVKNHDLFKKVVKTAFNQRRKTIRNSLKSLTGKTDVSQWEHTELFSRRPETLSGEEFVLLTSFISELQ